MEQIELGITDDGNEALIWREGDLVCINTGAGSIDTVRVAPAVLRSALVKLLDEDH